MLVNQHRDFDGCFKNKGPFIRYVQVTRSAEIIESEVQRRICLNTLPHSLSHSLSLPLSVSRVLCSGRRISAMKRDTGRKASRGKRVDQIVQNFLRARPHAMLAMNEIKSPGERDVGVPRVYVYMSICAHGNERLCCAALNRRANY